MGSYGASRQCFALPLALFEAILAGMREPYATHEHIGQYLQAGYS